MGDMWHATRWRHAIYASDLQPLTRLVALVYADFARRETEAWVTLKGLSEMTGMARSTAQQHRSRLVDEGWLVEVRGAGQHKASVYALTFPEGVSTGFSTGSQGAGSRHSEPPRVPGAGTPGCREPAPIRSRKDI